ncbi:MAG: HyaD/HybD family hydrogenase maturation endopeptidase [Anaerolineae bacterium]
MSELPVLVLALGNPLRGDDGVGAAVIEALAAADLPPGVRLLDGGTPGLETALLLQGYTRVIIVDAAEMGLQAGKWRRFTPAEADLKPHDVALRGTLHSAGLAEALVLAGALGILPGEIVIFGVQPERIGWEPGLSASIRRALPGLCRAIREEIGAA